MPVVPILVLGSAIIGSYVGAGILTKLATATITVAGAGLIGSLSYKMYSNTKSKCDLFSVKKCK